MWISNSKAHAEMRYTLFVTHMNSFAILLAGGADQKLMFLPRVRNKFNLVLARITKN